MRAFNADPLKAGLDQSRRYRPCLNFINDSRNECFLGIDSSQQQSVQLPLVFLKLCFAELLAP